MNKKIVLFWFQILIIFKWNEKLWKGVLMQTFVRNLKIRVSSNIYLVFVNRKRESYTAIVNPLSIVSQFQTENMSSEDVWLFKKCCPLSVGSVHRWCQNGKNEKSLWCSHQYILMSSVVYNWTDTQQHGIYLFYIIQTNNKKICLL